MMCRIIKNNKGHQHGKAFSFREIKTKILQLENKMSSGRAIVMTLMEKDGDEIIPCLQHRKLEPLTEFSGRNIKICKKNCFFT